MKRNVIARGLLLLAFAVPAMAQTVAPKPRPEQKKVAEIWVGDWTYEGQAKATPLGPAGPVKGKASVRPLLGGFFVEWRGEGKGPTGTTQWVAVEGYDPAA